jgi:hypothetical protein
LTLHARSTTRKPCGADRGTTGGTTGGTTA